MTFEQMEAEKQKYAEKNISFEKECEEAIKFIQEKKPLTIKRSNKNATKTTKRK